MAPPDDLPPTLADIAHRAGVGIATASRALSHGRNVAPATLARVREAADSLGYRPNVLLSAVAARRFRRGDRAPGGVGIALLQAGPTSIGAVARQARPVRERAEQLGYRLVLEDCGGLGSLRPVLRRLELTGVVGVMLTPWPGAARLVEGSDWSAFSVVCCGRQWGELPFDMVHADMADAVRQAWQHVQALAFRRPGFVLLEHEPEHEQDFERRAAARECVRSAGGDPEAGVLCERMSHRRFPQRLATWLRRYRPDAVIAFPNSVTYAVRDFTQTTAAGALPCFSLQARPTSRVNARGVEQIEAEVGITAVEWLDQAIRLGRRGLPERPRTLLLKPRWLAPEAADGGTASNARGSSAGRG